MPKQFNFWIVASGDAARKICNYLSKQIIYMRNNQYKKTFYTLQREMLLQERCRAEEGKWINI